MNKQIITAYPKVNPIQSDSTTTPSDATLQAELELGELAFLANTYTDLVQKGASQDLINQALAAFQKLYALYQFKGGTLTFGYNEGAQQVTITDPMMLEMFQKLPTLSNPPTGAQVSAFTAGLETSFTWSDGSTGSIFEKILLAAYDSKYCMANNTQNGVTNTAYLLFYLSLVNSPGASLSGIVDDLLKEGVGDSMLDAGNLYAISEALFDHVSNDSTILSLDILQAGLSISTKDTLYSDLGAFFQSFRTEGTVGNEQLDWYWEGRFFPFYASTDTQPHINALPDQENAQLENQLALEKKAMRGREVPLQGPIHKN